MRVRSQPSWGQSLQVQVGHESDSSTAIYTHVSDDFMNTALHKALAPALDPDPDPGSTPMDGKNR
ncbi:hypothetical protein GCM10027456_82490 [Kineosporia babensis]